MTREADLRDWWERRTDDQRAQLQQAARRGTLEPSTFKLLFDTGCPNLPPMTQWRGQEPASYWPSELRKFIAAQ